MNIEEKVESIMNNMDTKKLVYTERQTIKNLVEAIMVGVNEEFESIRPKQIVLKVKRSEDAKQFPMIHAKKAGDVGFDLPAVMPYKRFLQTENARRRFINRDRMMQMTMTPTEIERLMRETIVLIPHHRATVPTGIYLDIPMGYWASIEARSSTSERLIEVPKGVIDEGYKGELFAVLINVGTEPVEIFHGDRYVQIILHKRENMNVAIEEVDELSTSERGSTGFGSTNQNEEILVELPKMCCQFKDIETNEDPNNIDMN